MSEAEADEAIPPAPATDTDGTDANLGKDGAADNESCLTKFQSTAITKLLCFYRIGNIVNGLAILTLYPVSFFVMGGIFHQKNPVSYIFFMVYCMGFALFMILFEFNIKKLQQKLRSWCGFMFTFIGRTSFLFFICTMLFLAGIMGDWLGYVAGGITLVNAGANCFLFCCHPAFKPGGEMSVYTDMTESYKPGADEIKSYIEKNPELAAKASRAAAKAAVQAAKNNPDLLVSAMSTAAAAKQSTTL